MIIFKRLIIGSYLTILLLNADSFAFNTQKNEKVENTKSIIATGYGENKKQALNNAFNLSSTTLNLI